MKKSIVLLLLFFAFAPLYSADDIGTANIPLSEPTQSAGSLANQIEPPEGTWIIDESEPVRRSGFGLIARGIISLLVVCGLIILTVQIIKWSMKDKAIAARDDIRIVGIKHLTPKLALYIVEIEGARLLLGVGDGGIRLIKDLGERTAFLSALREETGALNGADAGNTAYNIEALAKEIEALKKDMERGLSDEKA